MNKMRNFFNNQGNGGNGNLPGPFGNIMNIFNKFQEFMTNPINAMFGSGLNIPQNIQNNPEAITNFLRASGKMTDDQFNQASQMAQMAQNLFGKKF